MITDNNNNKVKIYVVHNYRATSSALDVPVLSRRKEDGIKMCILTGMHRSLLHRKSMCMDFALTV